MKFDFIIGNPPYQETVIGTSDAPIYNTFMDAAYKVANRVELITPARFLFNAGKTPKAWNEKMLNDEHFKVLSYEPDSKKIFANTAIEGGIAIHYHDVSRVFDAIQTFTSFPELNTILHKVKQKNEPSFSSIVASAESYKFTSVIYKDHPEILEMTIVEDGKNKPLISKGHEWDLVSNIFNKLKNIVFFQNAPEQNGFMRVYGRLGNERTYMWIKNTYVTNSYNIDKYKVFVPKANGASGKLGNEAARIISWPVVGKPNEGHTQTFISVGAFETEKEAIAALKYIKGKFCRVMLAILKVTQINQRPTWKFVPLQNFTENSDIDWSKSIPEIDRQLYAKYGLDEKEIEFIETHVKEMK